MKLPVALLALAAPLVLAPPAPAQDAIAITALQRQAKGDPTAFAIVEGLTTEIGPRLAGSDAERRARDWAVKRLTELGFANVRIEPFTLPYWERGIETAAVVAPYPQPLAITALGNSASTGPKGLIAPITYFRSYADLIAAAPGSLKGSIAFVDHAMAPTQDGSSYGFAGPARWTGANEAAKRGAAAIVIRSVGTDHHRNPHAGGTTFDKGVKPIPAGALSLPDADNLRRMVERGAPVTLRLTLTPTTKPSVESGNVVAELPGSDPSLAPILAACHLDSWDLATGAFDDAAGCAIITAAAKLAHAGTRPKRTIRLLWAGAEEVGVFGGEAYGEAHRNEPHALAMESDFGADRVWRVDFKLPQESMPLADRISAALAPLGIARGTGEAGGGADTEAIAKARGVPMIDLQQDGSRYFDLHHTPDDTLDKIDPAQLAQNVAAWATVFAIAGQDDRLRDSAQ